MSTPTFLGKSSHGPSKKTRTGARERLAEQKRKEAEERAAVWQVLSPVAQLAELDRRFGQGFGAPRQRARLERFFSTVDRSENKAHGPQHKKRHHHDNESRGPKAVLAGETST